MKEGSPVKQEFRDTRFMTAAEKAAMLDDWERFLEQGFERAYFTKPLYDHLVQNCQFIAHYDRGGFHDHYFGEKKNTGSFIRQFTEGVSAEYGWSNWLQGDYDDINQAMCELMRKYAPRLRHSLDTAIRAEDIAEARALLAKHGIQFDLDGDI
jgi:hypothetical protein